jgi:hypothetical protein
LVPRCQIQEEFGKTVHLTVVRVQQYATDGLADLRSARLARSETRNA